MSKQESKSVTTNQEGIHDDLQKIYQRYTLNYQRPIADFSKATYQEIKSCAQDLQIIFDFGCGIGESTYHLAKSNPDSVVIGIDKSLSRLERKNIFKKEHIENMHLFRGELLDLIFLIFRGYQTNELKIKKMYFLYPNPWPKKIHVKRRFHANPIAPFIFGINVPIVLRSNWKLYLEEFIFMANLFERSKHELKQIDVDHQGALTPFERKYTQSDQPVYELIVF